MAKLGSLGKPGFNAGNNYVVKFLNVSDIVIDPEISAIFKIQDEIRDEIKDSILKDGFDKSQPITVQKDTNILLDGHTRLAAAKEAGLEEIPVVIKEFENREEAILYTFERQVVRRNLSGAEILTAAEMIPDSRNKRGQGRQAEVIAKRLHVSPVTVYRARDILKNSSEEDKKAVKEGKLSIKAAHKKNQTKKGDKTDIDYSVSDVHGLPGVVKFLKGAVILLVEADQAESAALLCNHYLKKNEKKSFLKLLPKPIREKIL